MLLNEDTQSRRREVLRVLRASSDPMSIIAIADELVVHPNTVRFHLESLGDDGLVEIVGCDRKGPGRPPLMFRAVRQMDRGGTRHYQLLAEILTMHLGATRRPGDKALAAGRAWGHSLASLESGLESPPDVADADAAIDRLMDVLDGLGFAPERQRSNGEHDGAQRIGLRHCSFLELAERGSNVVCPVHLGLVQGTLAAWQAPVSAERLDAFVEPDLCLLHLKRTGTDT